MNEFIKDINILIMQNEFIVMPRLLHVCRGFQEAVISMMWFVLIYVLAVGENLAC